MMKKRTHNIALTLLTTALALGCSSAEAQEVPPEPEEIVEEVVADQVDEARARRRAEMAELERRCHEIQRERLPALRKQFEQARVKLHTEEREVRLVLETERARLARLAAEAEQRSRAIEERRAEGADGPEAEAEIADLLKQRATILERRAQIEAELPQQNGAGKPMLEDLRERFAESRAALRASEIELHELRGRLAELGGARRDLADGQPHRAPHDGWGRVPGPRGERGGRGGAPGRPGEHGEAARPGRPGRAGVGGQGGRRADRPFDGPGPRRGRDGDAAVGQRLEHLERAVRELHELLSRHGVDAAGRRRGEDAVRRRFDGTERGPGPRARGSDRRPDPVRGERPRPPAGAGRAPLPRGPLRGLDAMTEQLRGLTQRLEAGGEHPSRPTQEQVQRFREAMEGYMQALTKAKSPGAPDDRHPPHPPHER